MSKRPLFLSIAGPMLLETPLLNKGSAFCEQERDEFNLTGLLPNIVETIDEQKTRAYEQLQLLSTNIKKHIFLRNIQDTNETLYYKLITEHLDEIMPLIYTPTVGEACQQFSRIYRRARGLFISFPNRHKITSMLQNATKKNVKVIVVTDGERILGLGDQGIGGMGIPIGKLALYSSCGGISPAYTLPVTLDVGTNNPELLSDPMYMGWKNARIQGKEYEDFVDQFINAVTERWPEAMIQFEDFSGPNANIILDKYRDKICCFNDDIQGTAAVTVGTLMAACEQKNQKLRDQIITFCGAGSAGCGIAEQIIQQMISEGLTDLEARQRIFMINSRGLVVSNMSRLKDYQAKLSQPEHLLKDWGVSTETASLYETVKHSQSTVLIGVSAVNGLFTEEIVTQMASNTAEPIVLPLSNPTANIEATPADILKWTDGKAIVATGSPFEPVELNGQLIPISQCNNSYIFPGLGLAVIASQAKRVTNNMLMAASHALAHYNKEHAETDKKALLPPLSSIRAVSRFIAEKVYLQAIEDGVAEAATDEHISAAIEQNFWQPEYRNYRRTSI